MAASHPYGDREQALAGGRFYGSATRRVEHSCALFTDLHHHTARKLPAHCHDLPLFSLMLAGDYSERYVGQEAQFCPFSITFRPAGVPHQNEVVKGLSDFYRKNHSSLKRSRSPGISLALPALGGSAPVQLTRWRLTRRILGPRACHPVSFCSRRLQA